MSDRPTPETDAMVVERRSARDWLEHLQRTEEFARRLERQRDAAVEALTNLMNALESEAKAHSTYKVASDNFTNSKIEGDAYSKALRVTGRAIKNATDVLREIEGKS